MCLDKLAQDLRQAILPCKLCAVLDMAYDDKLAHCRRQFLVAVNRANLVFHKVAGLVDFADVVIICADPAQQAVATDCLGSRLCN